MNNIYDIAHPKSIIITGIVIMVLSLLSFIVLAFRNTNKSKNENLYINSILVGVFIFIYVLVGHIIVAYVPFNYNWVKVFWFIFGFISFPVIVVAANLIPEEYFSNILNYPNWALNQETSLWIALLLAVIPLISIVLSAALNGIVVGVLYLLYYSYNAYILIY